MNCLFKKVILSVIMILPSLAMASHFSVLCSSGQMLYYSITSDSTVKVVPPSSNSWTGFSMPTGELVIPETVSHDGVVYRVESIGRNAFYYCVGLTDVVIPNSVSSIGNRAFCHCEGITSLTLSESLERIGDSSFFYCNHLQSLVIPNSVTEIGIWAFGYCDALPSVTIGSSVSLIKQNAFPTPLQSVVSLNTEAPVWSGNPFQWNSTSTPIYIPMGSLSSYQSRWTRFWNFIETDFSLLDSMDNGCSDSCTFIIVGADSYGDGWNGGQLLVMQNMTAMYTFSIEDGSWDSCAIKVCKNIPVRFVWQQGNYDYEISFEIRDEGGNRLYDTEDPTPGLFYTTTPQCSDCHIPDGITVHIQDDSVSISWQPYDNTTWDIAIGYPYSDPNSLNITQCVEPNVNYSGLSTGEWRIYIRSHCGEEYSTWTGATFFIGEYLMHASGTDTLNTCNIVVFDDGGPSGNYSDNNNSTLYIFPKDSTKSFLVTGTSYTESTYDYLRIYDGIGTNGTCIFDDYGITSTQAIGPYVSNGPITVQFLSDGGETYSGYQVNLSCVDPPCQTTLSMYSDHYIGGWGDYRGSLSVYNSWGNETGNYMIANSPSQSFTTSFRQEWDSIRLVWNAGSWDDGDRFLLKDNFGAVRYTVVTNGQSNMDINDTKGNSWNNVNNITLPMSCSDSSTTLHHITYSPVRNGSLTINGFDYSEWEYVLDSSIITITATPDANTFLQYIKVNGTSVASPYTMTVTGDVSIEVSFQVNLPELHVTDLSCSEIVAGHSFNVSWTMQNDGNTGTPVGTVWTDRLYLSTVPYVDVNSDDPLLLGSWENISSLSVGQSYTNSITAQLPLRHASGQHYLIILSDAENAIDIDEDSVHHITGSDYCYNNIVDEISEIDALNCNNSWTTYRHDNIKLMEVNVSIPPLADLEVVNIVCPTTFYSGTQVEVTATIQNTGDALTLSEGWRDVLYISTSPDFSSSALQLASVWHNGNNALAPDSTYQVTFSGTVPLTWYGEAYFFVTTDRDDNEYEHIGNDNNRSRSTVVNIILTPPADLVVSSVSVPTVASNQLPLQVNYTVTNEGLGSPNVNYWVDRVYLSTSPTIPAIQLDSYGEYYSDETESYISYSSIIETMDWCILLESNYHHDGLSAGDSYAVSHSYSMPSFITQADTFYIIVYTDVNNDVFEYQSEDNNSLSSSASIISFFFPDLVVDTVIIPDSVDNNHDFTVEYTISNQGLGKAEGPWKNRITMSGNQLSLVGHNGVLMPGDNYTASLTVSLPNFSNSAMHDVTVTADYENDVDEKNAENNNYNSAQTYATVYKADFSLSNVHFPDTIAANHSVDINFTLHNNGKKSFGGQVIYNYYYSTDSILSFDWIYPINATYLHNSQQYTFISAGDSLLISQTLLFPSDVNDGDYYVHIIVDMNDWIDEENEENNHFHSGKFLLSHRPVPDLSICNIVFADTLVAGQDATITFDIVNNGETTELGNADILSANCFTHLLGNGSWCPVQMQTTPNPVGKTTIQVGETLHFIQTVHITPTLSGDVSFLLKVDAGNNIMELDENNNTVTLSRYVVPTTFDIEASSISAPDDCLTGDSIMVSWNIDITDIALPYIQQGRSHTDFTGYTRRLEWSIPSDGIHWTDNIYLSTDNLLSSDDILVAQVSANEPGDSYTANAIIPIPHTPAGDLFVILSSDAASNMLENDKTNNIIARAIHSTLAPMPNLIVSALAIDDVVTQRQGCMIHYTVNNSGDATATGSWKDNFYCGNILLASVQHNLSLMAGESYSDSVEIVIPSTLLGSYSITATTDAANDVYEHSNEEDNSLSRPVIIMQAPPCDLIVTNVEADANAVIGDNINVSWIVQNIGDNTVSGYVKDGVYLSADDIFDNNDIMIGSITYHNSFDVNGSIQRTIPCKVQGVTAGNYHVIVRTNIMRAFNEVSFENNTTASIATTELALPTLTIGQEETITIPSGSQAFYRMIVNPEYAGQTLSVTLTTEVDNAFNGLFMSYEAMPSSARSDYNSSIPYARNQQILIPTLQEGTYYLMTSTSTSNNTPQTVNIMAEIIDFEIIHINTASGTNTGSVTTKVTGAKFDTIMDFRLTDASGYTPAQKVKFENSTNSYVTFNLTDLPAGTYNVEAELPGGIMTLKENAFVVEQGLPAELAVNIVAPSSVRVGNSTTVNIEYGNNGSTDLNVSGFMVVSANGHPIGLTAADLANQQDTLTFSTAEPGMDPDIIRPNYFATKTIYVNASTTGMVSIYVYPIRRRY